MRFSRAMTSACLCSWLGPLLSLPETSVLYGGAAKSGRAHMVFRCRTFLEIYSTGVSGALWEHASPRVAC